MHNCNFIQIFSVLSPKPANGTVQEVGKKRMGMVLDNVTKSQTKLEINFGSPYEVQYDLLVVRKWHNFFFSLEATFVSFKALKAYYNQEHT